MNTRYLYILLAITCISLATTTIPYRHIRANMPIDAVPVTAVTAPEKAAESGISNAAGVDFTLSAGGYNYSGTVPADTTVLDAMNILASSSSFRFTSKDFSGMGAFVESINGKQNSNNLYWILYINGKSSDVGASQTTVHSGDTIEWRYEKGY